MSDPILVSYHGRVAKITLNQPKKLNALSADLYKQLGVLLREIALKDEITVTLLTGTGRFFSAGADFLAMPTTEVANETERDFWLRRFAGNNLDVSRAFYQHPKILVAALNGPAIGLSAALISHADFIFVTPETYILTPFTSLGLVAEGGSSLTFVQRLGLSKANEALLLSSKIPAQDLLTCGFANRIFPTASFEAEVMKFVNERFGDHLNRESILRMKKLIRAHWEKEIEEVNVKEVFGGLDRFLNNVPQEEFAKMAKGEKRHKL